ncbi:MAG: SDR family NAD(P)-dependent oxidoreductase [Pseudomonadota bacterium]
MKTILITGASDGIGLETAKALAAEGHELLLHGRNQSKLADAVKAVSAVPGAGPVEPVVADLADLSAVRSLAEAIRARCEHLDVLINNAGVFKTGHPVTATGLDVRFVVNAIAPYLLTQQLLPLMGVGGRVVNVSSAAQAAVDLDALAGRVRLDDMEAYAQSKSAIAMWSRAMAEKREDGPSVIALNPGSLLATKMVQEGFGIAGNDVSVGADVLRRAALSDAFADANGAYFDNDSGRFATPHPDARNPAKCQRLVDAIVTILDTYFEGANS